VFGSIPQRALTRGRTPLLLVNPTADGEAPPFQCRRILVPLDGSASHEPVLAPAARLASSMRAELHLVVVVPTAHTLSGFTAAAGVRMPMATRAVLDLAEQDAEAYVRSVRDRMGAEGLAARWSVGRGEPLDCPYSNSACVRRGPSSPWPPTPAARWMDSGPAALPPS